MDVLKIRNDANSPWVDILALVGEQGPQGILGEQGKPFTYEDFTPEQLESLTGPQGVAGKDGSNGKDGYTPVKGVDYYTESDKQEIINAVLASLPNGNEVSY